MTEDWRTAYGRARMELEEYKECIVPALVDKVSALEKENRKLRCMNEHLENIIAALSGGEG